MAATTAPELDQAVTRLHAVADLVGVLGPPAQAARVWRRALNITTVIQHLGQRARIVKATVPQEDWSLLDEPAVRGLTRR